MVALTHPVLSPEELAGAMDRAGWRAPIELIDGEVVVIPPSGGEASFAQTEIVRRLRTWQDRRSEGGRVLTDVLLRSAVVPSPRTPRGEPPDVSQRSAPGPSTSFRTSSSRCCRPARGTTILAPNGFNTRRQASESCGAAARAVTVVDASGERRLVITSPLLRDFAAKVAELFA